MALHSLDTLRKITHIPHRAKFDAWCSRLAEGHKEAIRNELQGLIEGDEVHTSSWMPGNNWTGTVWQPIYTDACQYDKVASGLCFGLFVWEAFMDHPENWSFVRSGKDGTQIKGLTYFRIDEPSSR